MKLSVGLMISRWLCSFSTCRNCFYSRRVARARDYRMCMPLAVSRAVYPGLDCMCCITHNVKVLASSWLKPDVCSHLPVQAGASCRKRKRSLAKLVTARRHSPIHQHHESSRKRITSSDVSTTTLSWTTVFRSRKAASMRHSTAQRVRLKMFQPRRRHAICQTLMASSNPRGAKLQAP